MPTRHEAIISALVDALVTHPAEVTREYELPMRCSEQGLLNVAPPGDPTEVGYRLGTGIREWERTIELEHMVQDSDPQQRTAHLDSLLAETGRLLHGSFLGGQVDYLDLGPPVEGDVLPVEGAESLKGAVVTVTLFYETSDNPLETQS